MHWIYLISVKIISSEICFHVSVRDARVTPECGCWVRLWHCGPLFFLLALIVFCARQPRKHWEQMSLAFRDKTWHSTSLKTKKPNRGFTSATAAGFLLICPQPPLLCPSRLSRLLAFFQAQGLALQAQSCSLFCPTGPAVSGTPSPDTGRHGGQNLPFKIFFY